MSCTSAAIAARAKANSKRKLINTTMMSSAATTACSAWFLTCWPKAGLTVVTLTSPPERLAEGVLDLALLLLAAYDRGPYLVAVLPRVVITASPANVVRQRGAYLARR